MVLGHTLGMAESVVNSTVILVDGEGALVLGGLAAAVTPLWLPAMPVTLLLLCMALSAMVVGGFWIGLNGWMRQKRGLNETIGSLLLSYVAIAIFNQLVEGPLRDPASLNKPSTIPLDDSVMIGPISDAFQVHWGLVVGVIACILAQVLVRNSVTGFSLQVVGGNVRTARMIGLPVAIAGVGMRSLPLTGLGLGLFAMVVVFQLVTLPVELDASRRAVQSLKRGGLLETPEEEIGVRSVLSSAALTYLAAAVTSIVGLAQLLLRLFLHLIERHLQYLNL